MIQKNDFLIGELNFAQWMKVMGMITILLIVGHHIITPGISSDPDAVKITEDRFWKELTVSVIDTQYVSDISRIKIITESGKIYYLDASVGNSKTISTDRVKVYAIFPNGEQKLLQSYTGSWASGIERR